MLSGIGAAFAKMTDMSVATREFFASAQQEGESVSAYAMRVKLSAMKLRLSHETLNSYTFIKGLADSELRKWANSFNMNFQQALETAIRSESDPEFHAQIAMSGRLPFAPVAIAAVTATADKPPQQKKEWKSSKRESNPSKEPRAKRQSHGGDDNQSRNCGRGAHRDKACPAAKSQCHNCSKVGHFSKVCRQKRCDASGFHEKFALWMSAGAPTLTARRSLRRWLFVCEIAFLDDGTKP
jgi:hypothetical protein